eukprot:GEMP01002729.1.p1 GENE.GEMP01002729.1~~GEMP01002729.1.p1  ORF type:complete len:815 (+),score=110.54 GEMP01002729.1:79-2523(+)
MGGDNDENQPQVKVRDSDRGGEPITKGGDGDISDGPAKNRGCTDILCLLLFVAHWFVFAYVAILGFKDGDGRRVVYPSDGLGRVCGTDKNDKSLSLGNYTTDFTEFKNLAFNMNVTEIFGPGVKKVICTGSAPSPAFVSMLATTTTCGSGTACRKNWETACAVPLPDSKLDIDAFLANPAGELKTFLEGSGGVSPLKTFKKYIYEACITNCKDMNSYSVNNATGARSWELDFDNDILWAEVWSEIVDLKDSAPPIFDVFKNLNVQALPLSVCPYPTRYCVFFPMFKTSDTAGRCLMQLDSLSKVANAAMKNGLAEKVGGGIGDAVAQIAETWYVFIIVGVVVLVIGVVFLIILRFTVGFFVWLSIVVTFLALLAAGGYSIWYSKACEGDTIEGTARETAKTLGLDNFGGCDSGMFKENDETLRKAYLIIGCCTLVIAAIYFLFVICSIKRIRLAIGLNKVAARFVYTNKKIIFVPVIQIICALFWWALWLACAVFAISNTKLIVGTFTWMEAHGRNAGGGNPAIVGKCTGTWPASPVWKDITLANCTCAGTMDCNDGALECYKCGPPRFSLGWPFWYLLFSLLWNNAVLVAIGQMTIAGAVGVWYFNQNNISAVSPVKTGLRNCFRYHLGSIAFGSLILAIVQLVKWWLRYWQKQLEAQKQSFMAKIAGMLAYCVHCFERCIKFLNKNAYIRIALTGENFCKAAWKAFQLIIRNLGRYAVVGGLGSVISRLGTIFIAASSALCGYFIFVSLFPDENPWFCVAIYVVMGYVGGKLVMNVFGLAVDSVLVCFITDEEVNGAALNAPPELQNFYAKQ